MLPSPESKRLLSSPIQSLVYLFTAWKALLLLLAVCSPGIPYDTSTTLNQPHVGYDSRSAATLLDFVSAKLTRWDAIYFSKIASRGYLFEQEWAFGLGWTGLISFFSSGVSADASSRIFTNCSADLRASGFAQFPFLESFVGIVIAHASHVAAVILLYYLTKAIFPGPSGSQLGFVAACLHIISPAGIFLSAPYGESTFAALSFASLLFFVKSFPLTGASSFAQDFFLVVSGLGIGLVTTIRSNGLFYGLLFLEEAVIVGLSFKNGVSFAKLRRLACAGLGGLSIALGFLVPQYIAYREYCTPDPGARPWCGNAIPSIYTFVQQRYWYVKSFHSQVSDADMMPRDVGFLRYWQRSHIPLFILAAPMLVLLMTSGRWPMGLVPRETTSPTYKVDHYKTTDQETAIAARTIRLLRSLAYPQLVLAGLAITNYHVQIITRMASGYPILYIWLAFNLLGWSKSSPPKKNEKLKKGSEKSSIWRWRGPWEDVVVTYMVMYGLIQGVLFASFLPPA